VALVDIDHFKNVNDSFGHLIGDECLRLVANALKQETGRANDLLARYGGEEFAFILPATKQQQAIVVADRARTAVEGIRFVHRGQRIRLSVSIGVAGWVPETLEATEKLIRAADSALYEAKNAGRNRTVAAAC
jgi:diguanylate cyclase